MVFWLFCVLAQSWIVMHLTMDWLVRSRLTRHEWKQLDERGRGGNSFPHPDENIMNEHIYSGGNGALSLVDTLLALIFLILPIVLSQKFWQLFLQTFCELFLWGSSHPLSHHPNHLVGAFGLHWFSLIYPPGGRSWEPFLSPNHLITERSATAVGRFLFWWSLEFWIWHAAK